MTDADGDWIKVDYALRVERSHMERQFTPEEKRLLRPIAETLAMLEGNAFLSMKIDGGKEWYEMYLPEAYALFKSNGGLNGWASECCWIKEAAHENDSVRDAYENWRMLKALSRSDHGD